MSHPLDSVCRKIIRAEEHLKAIVNEIARCKAHCVITKENNPDTSGVKLIAEFSEPPLILSIFAGDCLHNLRSALDHLVWQLVVTNPIPSVPSVNNQFPICSDPKAWDSAVNTKRGRLDGVPSKAVAIIEEFQPYHFTPDTIHPLTWLRDLSNLDKHQTLPFAFVSTQTLLGDAAYAVGDADTVIWRGSVADADKVKVQLKRGLSVAFKEIAAPDRCDAGKAVNVILDYIREYVVPRLKPFLG